MHEITASELQTLQRTITSTAWKRRSSRNGRNAGEHPRRRRPRRLQPRHRYGHIDPAPAPPTASRNPRRNPQHPSSLTIRELEDINTTARVCGNDVILDALLLRLHTETACRHGGALAITLEDLDPDHCLVQLREKRTTDRPLATHHQTPLRQPPETPQRPTPLGRHQGISTGSIGSIP